MIRKKDLVSVRKKKKSCSKSKLFYISAAVILALYGFLFLMTFHFQGKILYHPSKLDANDNQLENLRNFGSKISEASQDLSRSGGWREINLVTEDALHNYWIHANTKPGNNSVPITILYLHGDSDRIVAYYNLCI